LLFNSIEFLFVFLPVCFFGAFLLFRGNRPHLALLFVVLCSFFFYGYWNIEHVFVIILSIILNYSFGIIIISTDKIKKIIVLIIGLFFNLILLGYFKYLGFFAGIFSAGAANSFWESVLNTALPIGISFYTFQQIAFLVDCFRSNEKKTYNLGEYAFFVTFFPQLIAGPIVHHAEIMPQLVRLGERLRGRRYWARYFAPGIALLVIGLIKKVGLADQFSEAVDPAFDLSRIGLLTFIDAWASVVAFALQIYFDFSAYSDIALGIALLFGLTLPINFLSPYKARSIIDFWRRWHITLSRFLRDYLYIPLGGNRHGPMRRYINLLLTMILGGFWHGANWTFLFWGLAHGLLLVLNHGMRRISSWVPPVWVAVPVTFTFVVLAWVAFRAESFDSMIRFYAVMFGADGIVLPHTYRGLVSNLGPYADMFNIRVGAYSSFRGINQILFTGFGLAIVFFAPSSMTLMEPRGRRWAMRSRIVPAFLGLAAVAATIVILLQSNEAFLYFQF
jgi:alginate O-acetyltransferase complex protein AlgI